MLADLRARFNQSWTPGRYAHFRAALDRSVGRPIEIPISETPCFFPKPLIDRMVQAGQELVAQLLSNGQYRADSQNIIPAAYRVPNEAPYPLFVCADFGLIRNASGEIEPRLVEIQGFPSLYGFQPRFGRQYIESFDLDPSLTCLLSGLNHDSYYRLLCEAIVGSHDPANVILMEIDPERQKTIFDFIATKQELGIDYVCITRIKKQGNKLYYDRNGVLTPIHRIYNRTIVDELERKKIDIPFDWRDDLDVEWAGHPNWFFRLSKFSIPYFQHDTVPRTEFFHRIPDNPEDYVLKPLYSFAGLGVIVGPTREQLQAIPEAERLNYILQERVRFEPVIQTPHGPTQAEIRIMYLWQERPVPVTTIVRMGRGKMMGVDHNKGLQWVGGSAGLIPTEEA